MSNQIIDWWGISGNYRTPHQSVMIGIRFSTKIWAGHLCPASRIVINPSMWEMAHNKQWFLKRIGERIYRDDQDCPCDTCKRILEEGLVIEDRQHAEYLWAVDNDFESEGINSNYRDEK